MPVKAVFMGLLLETKEDDISMSNFFEKMGFTPPEIIHKFETLPGQGGEGGRSDIIVSFADEDIPRLSIHPLHLTGAFSWLDDYIANNREIIPEKTYELMGTLENEIHDSL